MQGLLFGDAEDAAEPTFRDELARELRRLAADRLFFGGSSWKYGGWLDAIYTRSRYLARGRFSDKRFQDTCIGEYAEVFPTVCGDFSFYQFPSDLFWSQLFSSAPEPLKFSFKVPEFITTRVYPNIPRWGHLGGLGNELFLDFRLLETDFLQRLRPYRHRVHCLIFEFSPVPRGLFADAEEFAARLIPFLAQLPDEFRYAVEIRNPEFLEAPYFTALRNHGVAHVFNSWTRMPPLASQIEREESFTAGFVVARALLQPGRSYEEAVTAFEPYDRVREPQPAVRQSLFDLARRARLAGQDAYLYVNNRLEGNAPGTIQGVIEMGL